MALPFGIWPVEGLLASGGDDFLVRLLVDCGGGLRYSLWGLGSPALHSHSWLFKTAFKAAFTALFRLS